MWLELAREGYESLKRFATTTILPNILEHYNLTDGAFEQIQHLIYWRFFDRFPETPSYVLNALQRIISETKFEVPFLETIERLTSENINSLLTPTNEVANIEFAVKRKAKKQFYVYALHNSKSIDIRGAINYFGGSGHTSDLLLVMGPSLFQQISRRKLTSAEMRLCRKFRHLFTEFIKTGNPTGKSTHISNAWHPYTKNRRFIQILSDASMGCELSDDLIGPSVQNGMFTAALEKNFVEIDAMIHNQAQIISSNILNPFRIGDVNLPHSAVDSARMSKSYLGGYSTSEYNNALTKIHSFWKHLLPKIILNHNHHRNHSNPNFDDPLYVAMITATGTKFKHAFFSMLILVCLLLAVLCICVYILKRNQETIGVSFL